MPLHLPARMVPKWTATKQFKPKPGTGFQFRIETASLHSRRSIYFERIASVKVKFGAFEMAQFENQKRVEMDAPIEGASIPPGVMLRLVCTLRDRTAARVFVNHEPERYFNNYKPRQLDREEVDILSLYSLHELSRVDTVIVMDSYNKALAWRDLFLELAWKRLLHQHPELIETMGASLKRLHDHVLGILDLTVRALRPEYQQTAREAYGPLHPSPDRMCNTLEEYFFWLLLWEFNMEHMYDLGANLLMAMGSVPYMEEYEQSDMALGHESAFFRFWIHHVMDPYNDQLDAFEAAIPPDAQDEIARSFERTRSVPKREVGGVFYRYLFEDNPDLISHFQSADIDSLAGHLGQTLEIMADSITDWRHHAVVVHHLSEIHRALGIGSKVYAKLVQPIIKTLTHFEGDGFLEVMPYWTEYYKRVSAITVQPLLRTEHLFKEAKKYLEQVAEEQGWAGNQLSHRLAEVEREIRLTGTYKHTSDELVYGAQLAWRNSAKCIGRIHWNNLVVRDMRQVSTMDRMFEEVQEHLRIATSKPVMQAVMTVFRPRHHTEVWGPRFWNDQLVRYACYELEDGKTLGDKANLGFTKAAIEFGWAPPGTADQYHQISFSLDIVVEPKTAFDVLPIIIETPHEGAKLFELPEELVQQVDIRHPTNDDFNDLELKWCAVPAITSFRLTIGGIDYCACPFNGWFMGTEVARDLIEPGRYDLATQLAKCFKVDMTSEQTLWRDEIWLHLNRAVLLSFQAARRTMVDHYTASKQFLRHDMREKEAGRECPAQWSWVAPSAGGSMCPVWHHEMREFDVYPQYHYQAALYEVQEHRSIEDLHEKTRADSAHAHVMIVYGSESGTSEEYARHTSRCLRNFQPTVHEGNSVTAEALMNTQILICITSTFGEGRAPENFAKFFATLEELGPKSLAHMSVATLALGSSIYEHFCKCGYDVNTLMVRKGAKELMSLTKADELRNQGATFEEWLETLQSTLTDGQATESTSILTCELVSEVPDPQLVHHDGSYEAECIASKELVDLQETDVVSVRAVTFKLKEGSTYTTGDHLVVFPQNPAEQVERLIAHFEIPAEQAITYKYNHTDEIHVAMDLGLELPATFMDLLAKQVDITFKEPFHEVLKVFYDRATDEGEQMEIETWRDELAGEHEEQLRRKIDLLDNYIWIADLLDEFPSVKLTLEDIPILMPPMKPRLYSISSAAERSPHRAQITVKLASFKTDAGKGRDGIASSFLNQLPIGAKARIRVKKSTFRAPEDPNACMIMIGPGTGVAPLLAFCEREEVRPKEERKADRYLFFGSRKPADHLARERMEEWQQTGVLTKVDVAYSRAVPGEKTYVQDLIIKRGADLWNAIQNTNPYIYICGDARMAEDVHEALLRILKVHGRLNRLSRKDLLHNLKARGQYQVDVWGVGQNYKENLAKLMQTKHRQASAWLNAKHEEEQNYDTSPTSTRPSSATYSDRRRASFAALNFDQVY
nr:nitric oxid synthase [Choanoeca flexa]|eukprot:TRINITY_DN12394_c0_g2_i6.p1 TRINITY_DN12394_c0_g2~~TRINITY_DN12394_c0_g2_i6.p1  ORF type:complete len:1678 (+),score=341.30 TRINITY_DN12394_c0_g2_i6:630-5036(+)